MRTKSLILNWPQYAVWMHSHSHSYATHMNASREKALWHILTYAGLETVLISQSEIQRQRHTAGEREGKLTHWLHPRPHYCSHKILSKAVLTKFLLQNKNFKHYRNWPIRKLSKIILKQSTFVASFVFVGTVVLQAWKTLRPAATCVGVQAYLSVC